MTRVPDYSTCNSDPRYIRQLIKRTGMTLAQIAERTGTRARTLLRYVQEDGGYGIPYAQQFMLEVLADSRDPEGGGK